MPSVEEYAKWRGVSPQRVRQMVRSGDLPARVVGKNQWEVDDYAYAIRPRVRPPMSQRMAWAFIALISGEELSSDIVPSERSRLRARVRELKGAADAPALISAWLHGRGQRHAYRAAADDLSQLADDERILLSGVSDERSGLSSGAWVEFWMRRDREADGLIDDYLLVPDPRGRVVLHRGVDQIDAPVAPFGLVLADLSDWNSPREDALVDELLSLVQ